MTFSDNLTLIGILVTAVGSVATVIGLVFVWLQVRSAQQSAKGEFLLHMAEMLRDHDPAYQCLIDRANWSNNHWEPGQSGVSELDMDYCGGLLN